MWGFLVLLLYKVGWHGMMVISQDWWLCCQGEICWRLLQRLWHRPLDLADYHLWESGMSGLQGHRCIYQWLQPRAEFWTTILVRMDDMLMIYQIILYEEIFLNTRTAIELQLTSQTYKENNIKEKLSRKMKHYTLKSDSSLNSLESTFLPQALRWWWFSDQFALIILALGGNRGSLTYCKDRVADGTGKVVRDMTVCVWIKIIG